MSMDEREVRSFLVLAEQLHFRRAADLLHISQPALSKQIKSLEATLGGALLIRNRRDVRLTPAGTLLYQQGRKLMREMDVLTETTQAVVRGEAGKLRVAVGLATVHSIVPPSLRRFREAYPRIEVQVGDMSTPRQIEALLAGDVDVGFVRLPVDRPPLEVRRVVNERLTIAASSSLRSMPTLKDLAQQPFLMVAREVSTTYHDHCVRLCTSAGFSPRVVQEARDMFTLLNLVRAGIGVALVPRSAMKMRVAGVKFAPVHSKLAEWEVGVAWNGSQPSAAVSRLVQICLEERGRFR